ncbi:MAG: DUF29 domain-containing protein [Aquificaceae bacterium]|nr:DUF29 domain-containing protein [Aquificaceae bacterium]
MKAMSRQKLKELYDKDFPLWAEINYELLKERAYELVDWENLLEEIEDMARRHLDSAVSYLAVILEHMYKWDNFRELTKSGKEKGGLGWIRSIELARGELEALMEIYPSLKEKVPQNMNNAWKMAVPKILHSAQDLGKRITKKDLPSACPYTYEEAMTRDLRKELKP